MTQEPTPPKRIWKCAGCGLQMPGDCSCVTNVATSWEPDHMMVFKDQLRLETTSENIARDMSEGRFPERSEPQVVVIPEAERKTILASEADAMVAAALREAAELVADDHVSDAILNLADNHAAAALDKLIAEAVNEAMLQCTGIVANLRNKRNPGPLFEVLNRAMSDIEDARFAAIREKNNG